MPTRIRYVGGTMDTETELVASAAAGQITVPALDGLPEETYRRIDPPDRIPCRFQFVDGDTPPNTEGRTTLPNLDVPDRFGNVDCPDCWPHDDSDCVCETCQGTGYLLAPIVTSLTTTTEGSPA